MRESTQDMYAMQADQQGNVGTTQYNQGKMGRGNYRGRGRGKVIGKGQGPIICYRCNQHGHFARECTRPNFTCLFCKYHEHVIEDCPTLLQRIGPWPFPITLPLPLPL
jgi:hypothetical protein